MNDLKFAFRQLLKNPGFTTVSVLTLALGIGANTAIFSVINGVLLRPLPYRDPTRLVWLYQNKPTREWLQWPMGIDKFAFWREQSRSFEQIALAGPTDFYLSIDHQPELIRGLKVSANLCDLLGVQPAFGRAFQPEENQPGAPDVVILTHHLWQKRFGGDPAILGQTIHGGDRAYTVVGVLPAHLRFPMGPMPDWRVDSTGEPEIWFPVRSRAPGERDGDLGFVIGRLKRDVSLEQAQAEMTTLSLQHEEINATEGWSVDLVPLRDQAFGHVRPALLLLVAAVSAVWLIACVNVANLLLARSMDRQKEFAIRSAIGAGRFHLVRQLLTESLLLGALGGTTGVLLAWCGIPLLTALSPAHLPRAEEIGIDDRVLSFTAGLSLLASFLFGLASAWQVSRADLNRAIQGVKAGFVGYSRPHGLRQALVTTEVALAFTLLIGAGLLIQSFGTVLQVKPGYQPERLIAMNLLLKSPRFPTDESKSLFVKGLIERLEGLPGVVAAGFSFGLPLAKGVPISRVFKIDGAPDNQDSYLKIRLRIVSSNYFAAMGIPLLRGRNFSAQSQQGDRYEVLLNECAARRAFPGQNPVGKQCNYGPIVGVVGDTLEGGLDRPAEPQFYLEGYSASEAFLVVRTKEGQNSIHDAVMREIAAAKDLPVHNLRAMEQMVSLSLGPRRFQALLLSAFASLALALTAVGIYGVIACTVRQRTREMGVRIALGARTGDVFKLMIREGMRPVLLGLLVGIWGGLGISRVLANHLFGLSPTDPSTFLGVSAFLLLISLLACWLPARRAAKVDPMEALRYE